MFAPSQRHVVRLSAASAATRLAALSLGASPGSDHPDTNAGAVSICGSSYLVVKDRNGAPARRRPTRARHGHVYLLYSRTTGKSCVVTIKSRYHGTSTFVYSGLHVQ